MKNNRIIKNILEKQLSEISSILRENYEKNENLGVLSGISGICLFQFYYAKYLNSDSEAYVATDILKEAIDRINNGYNFPSYCKGLAGFGWLIEHLVSKGFIELDADSLLSGLDEYLYKIMMLNTAEGNYDFLHGGVGYGMYFFKRFKNTKSGVLKRKYKQYLIDLIKCIEKVSERDNNAYKWVSKFNHETNEFGYDLSLSHGISGIINFLSRLYQHIEFKEYVGSLLDGAISYLLKFENLEKNPSSFFPSWILNFSNNKYSRLAWCYGDLGVGLSLRMAAEAFNDDFLHQKSLQIFRHSVQRKTLEQTMVKGISICHGSFGNAQIYNRLYRETNEDIFKNAAEYWINQGILMTNEMGVSQIKEKNYMFLPDWSKEINFLTGIPGIGMSILFHLSDLETNWDECLMIV